MCVAMSKSLASQRIFRAVLPAFLLAVSVGQIYAFTNFSTQIAEYIDQAAAKLLDITGRFDTLRKDSKVIAALCDDIKEIEHTVDDIFESYMSNLFEKEPDAKELIKKKNIAQALENTSDVAKVVSSKIRGIVVKNS